MFEGTDSESSPKRSERSRLFARTSTPSRDITSTDDHSLTIKHEQEPLVNKAPSDSDGVKEPDPLNKSLEESFDDTNTVDLPQTEISPENSSKDANMKLALDFISDNSTHSARSGKVFGASHKPQSPERSRRSYRPEFSPNKSLDKSLDLTSTTLQDDRPESRRSSMSNYSLSQPVSYHCACIPVVIDMISRADSCILLKLSCIVAGF